MRARDLVRRPPLIVYDDCSMREAADHMVHDEVGRLLVVTGATPHRLVGMLTRSDLLAAYQPRLAELRHTARVLRMRRRAAAAR